MPRYFDPLLVDVHRSQHDVSWSVHSRLVSEYNGVSCKENLEWERLLWCELIYLPSEPKAPISCCQCWMLDSWNAFTPKGGSRVVLYPAGSARLQGSAEIDDWDSGADSICGWFPSCAATYRIGVELSSFFHSISILNSVFIVCMYLYVFPAMFTISGISCSCTMTKGGERKEVNSKSSKQ